MVDLKFAHAEAAPRYDAGLFGNSRSMMVGRPEIGIDGCRFFNFGIPGSSLRSSAAALELLRARGKAPRLALVSLDNLEVQMIANPRHLPLGSQLRLAVADMAFAISSAEVSGRDALRMLRRHAMGLWSLLKETLSAELFLDAGRRLVSRNWVPARVLSEGGTGYRSDGSHVPPARAALPPPLPTTSDQIIDAFLVRDLTRLKALEDGGEGAVEKVVVYESPLHPIEARRLAGVGGPAAAHRETFLKTCAAFALSCLAAPAAGLDGPQKNAWQDASHAPPETLGAYVGQLARETGLCGRSAGAAAPGSKRGAP